MLKPPTYKRILTRQRNPMRKFELCKLDGHFAQFEAKIKFSEVEGQDYDTNVYCNLDTKTWVLIGRPVELFITIEGLPAKSDTEERYNHGE